MAMEEDLNGLWRVALLSVDNYYNFQFDSNGSSSGTSVGGGDSEITTTRSPWSVDNVTIMAVTSGGGGDRIDLGFGFGNSATTWKVLNYIFGIILILFSIGGVCGNGLVLYVFTRYRRLRGAGGGPLILSLASGDLMVAMVHFMPAYSSFKETWGFGVIGCELYAALVGLGGLASLITLSVIAVDRYGVILGRPQAWLSGKKIFSQNESSLYTSIDFFRKVIYIMVCWACASIWLFCLCLVFPPTIGWSRYVPEGLNTSCSWDYETRTLSNRSYYLFLLIFGFCLPVTAIVLSYVGILRVIRQHSKIMKGVTINGITHDHKIPTKNDLKTTQVILTIIICFLISWTPYAVVSLIGQFGPVGILSPLASAMPAIFAKASVIYNPIIYGLTHPQFRSVVRTLRKGRQNYPATDYANYYKSSGRSRRLPFVDTGVKNNGSGGLANMNHHRHDDVKRQISGDSTVQLKIDIRTDFKNFEKNQKLNESNGHEPSNEIVVHVPEGHWFILGEEKKAAVTMDACTEEFLQKLEKSDEQMMMSRKCDFGRKAFCKSDNCLPAAGGDATVKAWKAQEQQQYQMTEEIAGKNLMIGSNHCTIEGCDRSQSDSNLEKLRKAMVCNDDDEIE